jgi:23S rRNA pseudouridine2605 synthase
MARVAPRKKKTVARRSSTAPKPVKKKTAGRKVKKSRPASAKSRPAGAVSGKKKPYRATVKKRRSIVTREAPTTGPQRLQKVLASAGLGSRRDCEELIIAGRVEVDRKVVTELGTKVDPQSQNVRVDGEVVLKPKLLYFAVFKPDGVISTNSDPAGRPRVIDLLPPHKKKNRRMFTVGRLDMHSEGLILLTNDGELANRLTHPRYGIEKEYLVQVAGHVEREVLQQIREGVYLSEGLMKVAGVKSRRRYKQSTLLDMTLNEGRNREIRRVMAKVGHKVQRLTRVSVGPIRLGKMEPGECRPLNRTEVTALRKATGL